MKKTKNQTIFTQRFLAQLGKFKDTSTISSGHLQIRALLAETDIEDAQTIFALLESDSSPDRAKKEQIKICTSMIEVYGLEILDYFQKLIAFLMKRHSYPNQSAEVFTTLIKLVTSIPNEEQQLQRLYYIQKLFENSSKDVFTGTCWRSIIKQLPLDLLRMMENQLCLFLSSKIQQSKTKVQLIEAVLSLLLALEENFSEDDFIRNLVQTNFKSEDWNVRKSLIDVFYALLVLKGPTESDNRILEMVKQAKYDKIKTVRDAAINCLSIFKTEVEEKSTTKKQPIKPWKTPKPQAKQPIVKQVAKPKVQRNESFFQKAKLENEITIHQPETSSIQMTDPPFDIPNYERRGFNDTIEQIQSMMPKGLSIAQSMFKYDESKDFEEQKKQQSSPIIQDIHEESLKDGMKYDMLQNQIKNIHKFLEGFQKAIVDKLKKLETRIDKIQRKQQDKIKEIETIYLRQEHPQSFNISKQQGPHEIHIKPYMDSTSYNKEEMKNFSEDIDDQQLSINQKILMHLKNNSIQSAYQIAFTQGEDSNIIFTIQKTGMAINQLDKLHADFLVYKVRQFLKKGVDTLRWLRWLVEYFKEAQNTGEIEWAQFLRKLKCRGSDEERVRNQLVLMQSRIK